MAGKTESDKIKNGKLVPRSSFFVAVTFLYSILRDEIEIKQVSSKCLLLNCIDEHKHCILNTVSHITDVYLINLDIWIEMYIK